MHRVTRTWNIPLGIGLFGAAILVGGAILAIPETTRAPSHVDVSDAIATKPFPSFPEETHPTIPGSQLSDESATTLDRTTEPHEPLPAPSAVGGGPGRSDVEGRPQPRPPPEPLASTPTPAPSPAPAPAPAASPQTTPAPSATPAAPPPPPVQAAPDGGIMIGDAAVLYPPDGGGLWQVQAGDASIQMDPNAPYIYPTNPQGTAGTAGTVVGSGGATAPASGTSGGSGGVTTTKQMLAPPLLLPVSESPEKIWSEIAPYLKSGDALLALATSDSSPLLSFSDRVKTDAPLVTYIVAFATPAQLESALSKGLPATLGVVGLSTSAGVSDATLNSLGTKVHDSGRRMFLSLKQPTDGPSSAAVSKSADIVELVVSGSTATELANNAKAAATPLGNKMVIYVRLPAAMSSVSAAPTAANAVTAAIPNAGVSLPASAANSISSFRTR